LNVNEDLLLYSYEDTFFQATSMAIISTNSGTAVVEGTGELNGEAGHTFRATVKDGGYSADWVHMQSVSMAVNNGSDDAMGFEIDGVAYPAPGAGPLSIIEGVGFTLTSGNVSGSGQTCPPATLNLNVLTDGGGSLRYGFKDIFFEATSINAPSISAGVATITGSGELNGEAGHTFTAAVEDNGCCDKMGFEIDGVASPVPVDGRMSLIGGAGFTVQE